MSYVNITKGVQYIHGREITVEPKTRLSRRRLPLPHELVRRIYQYRGEGRLLGNLHVHQAADRYRRWTKQLGLPYVPLSNLRTSWATYMVNSGAPISLISRYMGHADVKTTVEWYTKPREEDLDELTLVWSHPAKYKFNNKTPMMESPKGNIHYQSNFDNLVEDIPVVVKTNSHEVEKHESTKKQSEREKQIKKKITQVKKTKSIDVYDILDKLIDVLI